MQLKITNWNLRSGRNFCDIGLWYALHTRGRYICSEAGRLRINTFVKAFNGSMNMERGRQGRNRIRIYGIFNEWQSTECMFQSKCPLPLDQHRQHRCGVSRLDRNGKIWDGQRGTVFNAQMILRTRHVLFHCVLYDDIWEDYFNVLPNGQILRFCQKLNKNTKIFHYSNIMFYIYQNLLINLNLKKPKMYA